MSRKSKDSGDGPPDPAAWLDRLEQAIERKLPREPRPVWAGILVFVLRLALGRGSWVIGALLAALGAPWFVFAYRQVESMSLAAWYRRAATVKAEATVERIELRLLPWTIDGGQRVVPTLFLRLPEAAGGEPALVRYLPRGEEIEDYRQWYTSDKLLSEPPAVSPRFRLLWRSAASPAPGFDLTWRAEDRDALLSSSGWSSLSYLDSALADLDRPVDLLVGDWTRKPEEGRTVPVRYPPGNPGRLFVADALEHLPPSGGNGLGELFGAFVLIVPFGLPFWWFGTRLLGRGLPPQHRHLFVWVPLALLPLWGSRYLEVLEKLSPGALEQNALISKVGSSQVLPGSALVSATADWTALQRKRIDLASSRFAPLLARVDLAPPDRPLRNGAAVWRELSNRFSTAYLALDDGALAEALLAAAVAEAPQGTPALLPVLTETARRASLDPARSPEVHEAARNALSWVLQSTALDLCHPAYAAHREDLERLRDHADPNIAALTAARLTEIDSHIAARMRDWGNLCG